MARDPLAPLDPFAKPSPFDYGLSAYGPTGSPFDYGANPHWDVANTYEPTRTGSDIEKRRRRLYSF